MAYVIRSKFLHGKYAYFQSNNNSLFVSRKKDAEHFRTRSEAVETCTGGYSEVLKVNKLSK